MIQNLSEEQELKFLTEEEKQEAEEQIKNMMKKVNKLPCLTCELLAVLYESQKVIGKEDQSEERIIIQKYVLQKITNINNQAISQEFMSLASNIFQELQRNLLKYQENKNIQFLYSYAEELLRKKFYKIQKIFIVKKNQNNISILDKSSNLKEKVFLELLELLSGMVTYMKQVYEVQRNYQLDRCITVLLQRFTTDNSMFLELLNEDSQPFQKGNQKKQFKQEEIYLSKIIHEQESEQENGLIIEKKIECEENKQKWHTKLFQKAGTLLTAVNDFKGKRIHQIIINSVASYAMNIFSTAKNYDQKSLNELPLEQEHFQQYISNLQTHNYLTEKQYKYVIEVMAYQTVKKIPQNLDLCFTEEQQLYFIGCLEIPLNRCKEIEFKQSKVQKLNISKCMQEIYYILYQEILAFRCLEKQNAVKRTEEFYQIILFKLVFILYGALSKDYSIIAKRYLTQVCLIIQKQMISSTKMMYLIGALKIYQSIDVKRSNLLEMLHKQMPYRPEGHEMSQMSKVFHQNEKYCNPQESKQMLKRALTTIRSRLEGKLGNQKIPEIEFVKLTHSLPRKTITILISGFLSEDSDKYQEWIGALRAMEDSEIYAIKWESSTAQSMTKYLLEVGKDILLGSGSLKILGFAGPIPKAISIAAMVYKQFQSNPFNPAIQKAKITGIYLAELLMQHFQDNFINLVSFSLGTQVLRHTLDRLEQKQRLGMLNRIVTMGGSADKNEMEKIIIKSTVPLHWVNFHTQNDYLIRYLLKVCYPSVSAIGTNEIKQVVGHDICNINASLFVEGHLDYRKNMYNITRMLNLRDD